MGNRELLVPKDSRALLEILGIQGLLAHLVFQGIEVKLFLIFL